MRHHALRDAALTALLALGSVSAAPLTISAATPARAPQNVGAQADKKAADRPALKDYRVDKSGLAIKGYDPVAYFPAFGGKAAKGSKKITAKHRGVTYRFASERNKKAFLASPEQFEPTYGGWCAWAMADGKGSKTKPNPKSFTIENGRLYLFYDGFFGDTRKSWKKKGSAPKLASKADSNWRRISGEAPRPPVKSPPPAEKNPPPARKNPPPARKNPPPARKKTSGETKKGDGEGPDKTAR